VSKSGQTKQKAMMEKNLYTNTMDEAVIFVHRRNTAKHIAIYSAQSDILISIYIPRRRRFESRRKSLVVPPCSSLRYGQNTWPPAQPGHFLFRTASVKPPTDPTYVGARWSVHIFSAEDVRLRDSTFQSFVSKLTLWYRRSWSPEAPFLANRARARPIALPKKLYHQILRRKKLFEVESDHSETCYTNPSVRDLAESPTTCQYDSPAQVYVPQYSRIQTSNVLTSNSGLLYETNLEMCRETKTMLRRITRGMIRSRI
jgi:hypothetical protein